MTLEIRLDGARRTEHSGWADQPANLEVPYKMCKGDLPGHNKEPGIWWGLKSGSPPGSVRKVENTRSFADLRFVARLTIRENCHLEAETLIE